MDDGQKDISEIIGGQLDGENESILITPRVARAFSRKHGLNKELRPTHLFAFGVGAVVTGFFTHWSRGLESVGPNGFLIAILVVFFIYLIFFSVLAQFSSAFPFAGGPYAYARLGLGTMGGYLTGIAAVLQYVGATALVISMLRGYFSSIYPELHGNSLAFLALALLMTIHVTGIRISGIVEIFLTSTALSGLILFFLGSSHVVNHIDFFSQPVLTNGWQGFFTAMAVVILLFLGLEGVSVSAEETTKPHRDIPLSLMAALGATLIIALVVVYFGAGSTTLRLLGNSPYPLLFILRRLQSHDYVLLSTFAAINLSVFAASLHGLINCYSRQVYTLARAGYLPRFLGRMHPNRQTPYVSIIIPGFIGFCLSYVGSYEVLTFLITLSAIFVQIMVLFSFLKIRKSNRGKFCRDNPISHPLFLTITLVLLIVTAIILIYNNLNLAWLLMGTGLVVVAYYYVFGGKYIQFEAPEEAAAASLQNRTRVQFK